MNRLGRAVLQGSLGVEQTEIHLRLFVKVFSVVAKSNEVDFHVSSPARGSAIAKIVGSNAGRLAHFDPRVTMWVFEEDIGGRKLTEIINTQHENVKYLPGHKLPPNVVSSNSM